MKLKSKLLAILLIFVFIASVGTAVAEDVSDASNELKIDDVDEEVSVDEESDVVEEDVEEEDIAPLDDEEDLEPTTLSVKVDVLDKPVAGKNFRIKVTITNTGDADAENARAAVSFTDLKATIDKSFILVDDDDADVSENNGVYRIDFGYLGAGESDDVTLTFLATQSGPKVIVAMAAADNAAPTKDSTYFAFIDVAENSNAAIKANAAKETLPATGNPLVLLALALLAIIPCYRRR